MGSEGSITEIGEVPGRWAGADPTGRHVTTVDRGTVTTYETATLRPVASHSIRRPRLVATHPDGTVVAVIGDDWSIELWRDGRRVASRETGLGGSAAATGWLGGVDRAAWLAFTPGGGHLLAGLAGVGGDPARLDLLDAATLDRLDSSSALPGGYPAYAPGTPPDGWGEGVTIATAPPPAGTVAFAANVGDDPHVLAVADVGDGRLSLHTAAAGNAYAAQIPGERVNGIALDATGTLYVLDSDDILTAFAWRDPDRRPREIMAGYRLIEHLLGSGDGDGSDGDRADSDAEFTGDVFFAGGRLAVPIAGAPGGGMVIAFLDPATGRYTGRLDVPAGWSAGFVEHGLLRRMADGTTLIARWTAA